MGDQPDELVFSPERNRSGIIHWSNGINAPDDPEITKFAREHKVPGTHCFHFITYFTTYEARLRDTGEWIKLTDKGRITAMDDPEVRQLASRYGDPDELLREDWVPAIPGINYPGDYMRDYGQDPVRWIRAELAGQLPPTIGVPD